jgi:hypothetical protein
VGGAGGGGCLTEGKKTSTSTEGKKALRKKSPGGDDEEPVAARKEETSHALPLSRDRLRDRGTLIVAEIHYTIFFETGHSDLLMLVSYLKGPYQKYFS